MRTLLRVRTCLLVGLVAVCAACATPRNRTLYFGLERLPNPDPARTTCTLEVVDRREFSEHLADASLPSVGQAAGEIPRSRIYGRKWNANGEPTGNVLLNEPITMEQMIGEALANGLRESGIAVVPRQGEGATELDVEILRGWGWSIENPLWSKTHFDVKVRVRGPFAPFRGEGLTFEARGEQTGGNAASWSWFSSMNQGLLSLRRQIEEATAP